MERFLNDISDTWKNVICIGSGNEGTAAGHAAGRVSDEEEAVQELAVQEREPALNVQIWKSYLDDFSVSLESPGGGSAGFIRDLLGPQRFTLEQTEILLYYGEPSPYSQSQEIYIEFLPRETYVNPGIWTLTLEAREVKDGQFHLWLPSAAAIGGDTRFLEPEPYTTLTIPSTARRIVAVGAYDSRSRTYADFSGRGDTRDGRERPVLAAPGVDVVTTGPGGG